MVQNEDCFIAACEQSCRENETFLDCGTACEPICGSETNEMCIEMCVAGCFCNHGFIRDAAGTCVTEEVCLSTDQSCRENETFSECGTACEPICGTDTNPICIAMCVSGCFCNKGFIRDAAGTCVTEEVCQSTGQSCRENETFSECGTACEPICGSEPNDLCIQMCVAGCFCNEGFIRHTDGTCVTEEFCQSIDPCENAEKICNMCMPTMQTLVTKPTKPTTMAPTMPTTPFSPTCPEKGTLVKWKGAKVSRITYRSDDEIWMKVNFPNNTPGVDVVNGMYLGFMGFTRRKCSADFWEAFADGRIKWEVNDYGNYYTPQYKFNRNGGRHTSTMLQFFRHTVGAMDFGNAKKDTIFLTLTGLDSVNFGTKDRDACLTSVQSGTMHVDNEAEAAVNWTKCASLDKDLGW